MWFDKQESAVRCGWFALWLVGLGLGKFCQDEQLFLIELLSVWKATAQGERFLNVYLVHSTVQKLEI